MKNTALTILAGLVLSSSAMAGDAIDKAVASESRTAKYAARDNYRHPAATLKQFQVSADQTVVEIWPGGGWYTEILAPMLKESGTFYAAHFSEAAEHDYYKRSRANFEKKLAASPELYGNVKLTAFNPAGEQTMAPAGTVDRVLTFRNVHNWMGGENEQKAFDQFFEVLKPGGMLGVVEHRAKPGTSREDQMESGYVAQNYVVQLAQKAGFELVSTSEVNANAKDTADHPRGVWTLPPRLALGEEDREKYVAIGESDRMTLLFKKPE